MKTYLTSIMLACTLISTALAEMQFPDFESLSQKDQKPWGYTIQRTPGKNPSFSLSIAPAAASYCKNIRLYTKTKAGRLLAECNLSPFKNADGSLHITLNIFEELDGYSELIIYTRTPPEAAVFTNFGGFTFKLSKD